MAAFGSGTLTFAEMNLPDPSCHPGEDPWNLLSI
jgi:hypothetical protein